MSEQVLPEELQPLEIELRRIERDYTRRGLKFHLQPGPDLVPGFLQGRRPDAIAEEADGSKTIFEIKNRQSAASNARMADLARMIAPHSGWNFKVIYTNPSAQDEQPIRTAELAQVQTWISEAESLAKGSHLRAAFVVCWSILEALARLLKKEDPTWMALGASALQIVQLLAENGYLEGPAEKRLQALAKLRNAAVHGDPSTSVITQGQVDEVLTQTKLVETRLASESTS